jgi:hypothetical protein
VRVWASLIWPRIESSGGHLWPRYWIFECHKRRRNSLLAERVIFSHTILFLGVSYCKICPFLRMTKFTCKSVTFPNSIWWELHQPVGVGSITRRNATTTIQLLLPTLATCNSPFLPLKLLLLKGTHRNKASESQRRHKFRIVFLASSCPNVSCSNLIS